MGEEPLETLADLSERLHVPSRKLVAWARRGELPGAVMIGGRWRVKSRVIDRWLTTVKAALAYRKPFQPPTQKELLQSLLESPPSDLRDGLLRKLQGKRSGAAAKRPKGG